MDRPASKPGHVRTDPPPLLVPPPEQEPEESLAPSPKQRVSAGWRFTTLLWITAFGFLAVYEVFWVVLKMLRLK
jgi:hypothetical protein